MSRDYDVGYGKPPMHGRFRKGRSGNPKGRPKGAKNLKTDLKEELEEHIQLREGGQARRLSKQRALLKSLIAKGIKGDTRAATLVLNMVLRLLEAEEASEIEAPLAADEAAVLAVLEKRLMRRRPPQEADEQRQAPDGNGASGGDTPGNDTGEVGHGHA